MKMNKKMNTDVAFAVCVSQRRRPRQRTSSTSCRSNSNNINPLSLLLLTTFIVVLLICLLPIANRVDAGNVAFVSGFSSISNSNKIQRSTATARDPTSATTTPFYQLSSSTALLSASPVSTTNEGGGTSKKKKNKDKKRKKKNKSKPNRKHLEQQSYHHHRQSNQRSSDDQSQTQAQAHTETQTRSPVVVLPKYEDQLDPTTQQERRSASHPNGHIDCIHYKEHQCPGCSVDKGVVDVDIISSSSRQFFKSTAVQKHRLYDNHNSRGNGNDRYDDDEDYDDYDDYDDFDMDDDIYDDFYQVVVPSKVTGWRTQAKLVATNAGSSQWTRDGCQFGLYARGSHTVIPIPQCEVHHPSINQAVEILEKATRKVGTVAAHTNSQDGWMKRDTTRSQQSSKGYQGGNQGNQQQTNGLRYIQLQVERLTGKVQLVLVWSASQLKETQPSLSRLIKEIQRLDPNLWHSIWCHCNDSPGNNIFSRAPGRWHHMMGPEYVREPLVSGDEKQGWLYFSPLCFRQGNMDGFDVIAQDVARAVPGGSKVCELYAGVGLLGLTALAYHHNDHHDNDRQGQPLVWVRCSDENPANPKSFKKSVQSLPQEMTRHDDSSSSSSSSQSSSNNSKTEMTFAEIMEKMKAGEEIFDSNKDGDAPPRSGPKAAYLVASAGDALLQGQALGADVLIVDPPRKGLEDDVLDELCKPINTRQPMVESPNMLALSDDLVNWTNDVKTLIYVSCGFDALVRDCERLLSSPAGWKLQSSTGYVLFPGSNHVETLCIFQRK